MDETTKPAPAGPEPDQSPPSWLRLALFALVSRIVVLALGLVLADRDAPIRHADPSSAPRHQDRNERHLERIRSRPWAFWVEPWYRWDALWYAELAESGYHFEPPRQSTTGFLPLLPLFMAGARTIGLDSYVAGLLVPNLAFVAGLPFFGRLAWRLSGSRRVAWSACWLLVCYPASLFFSAPYQESLGFALVSLGLWAWSEQRPNLGAVSVAVAGLARLTTIVLSLGAVLDWAWRRVRGRNPRPGTWKMAAGGCFGVVAIMAIMAATEGEPRAHFLSHRAWGRETPSVAAMFRVLYRSLIEVARQPRLLWVVGPLLLWTGREWILDPWMRRVSSLNPRTRRRLRLSLGFLTIAAVVGAGMALNWSARPIRHYRWVIEPNRETVIMLGMLALAARSFARRGPLWGTLVAGPILLGISTGSMLSMSRIALTSFPAAIDAAELIRSRLGLFLTCSALAAIQVGYYLSGFVNWEFVG